MTKLRPSDITPMPDIAYRGRRLSRKQVRILERIGLGLSNVDIAEELQVSKRTIESHIVRLKTLIAKEIGYRLGDRELVLFAKEMLDGYSEYLKIHISRGLIAGRPVVIDDWDDSEDDLAEEFEDDIQEVSSPRQEPLRA